MTSTSLQVDRMSSLSSLARISQALVFTASTLTLLAPPMLGANSLATGSAAKSRSIIAIPVNTPEFLNWKSRQDVLTLRKQQVDKFPALLEGTYEPSGPVFNAIEDGKPWWGMAGAAVFGRGDKSIIGAAEESRFLMNPYMLVGLDSACCGMWDERKLSERDLEDAKFPYFWQPESIQFDAANSREIVTYNVSEFNRRSSTSGKAKPGWVPRQFSLVAYNARDMGFNYIWLDTKQSIRVQNDNATDRAVAIKQFIHCGGTCGYPGNCNNMSPFIAEIDRCRFLGLPARAVVNLWREEPTSVGQAPDFMVIIDMK